VANLNLLGIILPSYEQEENATETRT